jgi:hypothetical protein
MSEGPDRPTLTDRSDDQRQGHVLSPPRALAIVKKTSELPEPSFVCLCT